MSDAERAPVKLLLTAFAKHGVEPRIPKAEAFARANLRAIAQRVRLTEDPGLAEGLEAIKAATKRLRPARRARAR